MIDLTNLNASQLLELVMDARSDRLLSTREAADRLDAEVDEVQAWVRDGLVPVVHVAGRLVFRLGDLVEWQVRGLQQLAHPPAEVPAIL